MGNKLYVGNLPYTFRDSDLEQAFSEFGAVNSAKVMMERDTGRSKGFGFVEMGSDAEAQAAIQGLHGQNRGGRDLVVNEARPMGALSIALDDGASELRGGSEVGFLRGLDGLAVSNHRPRQRGQDSRIAE